jgi:predicted MFS family arabinose efflux permease
MSANRVRLFIICMLGAFVIAGFLAPYGLLVGPIAAALDAEIGVVGSLFSFFTGSIFVGYIVAFYIFDYVNVKTIILGGYGAVVLAVVLVILTPGLVALSIALTIIGFCCSLAVCGSVTLISQTWQGKQRQSALVAQDAAFNGGGIFFTAITAYLLGKNVAWQVGYVPAAAFALITVALAIFTRLRIKKQTDDEIGATTEWNAGIILVGVLVMLFMTAKLTFIVWAPQYLEQEFGASPRQAGILMSNVFQAAFLGSLIGTYIVSKIQIHYFLAAMILTGVVATFVMLTTEDLQVVTAIGYLFGLSVSATFNSYMALGLSFVASPNHRHVAYMLLAGAVGSALGPFISGQAVLVTETTRTPIIFAFTLMAVVFVCVIILSNENVRVKLKSISRSYS